MIAFEACNNKLPSRNGSGLSRNNLHVQLNVMSENQRLSKCTESKYVDSMNLDDKNNQSSKKKGLFRKGR